MGPVVVRYPGRACLLGEHCDWAGGASLTVPLPMGIEVRAESNRSGIAIHSELDGDLIEGEWSTEGEVNRNAGPLRFVPAAVHHLRSLGMTLRPTRLWVQSNLPAGRGFSSSAAFTLGILDALSRFAEQPQPTAVLAQHAFTVEHGLLGIACGRLDPAACAAGEPLFLRWHSTPTGEIEMTTRRMSPQQPLHLVVGAFSHPRAAAQILSTLSTRHGASIPDPDGDAVREAIAVFGTAAERGARAMTDGDIQGLGDAMNQAQQVYETNLEPRFSCLAAPRLRKTCAALRERGALGAKFSGAGGDGSVIGLFKNASKARSAALWLEDSDMTGWYVPVEAT